MRSPARSVTRRCERPSARLGRRRTRPRRTRPCAARITVTLSMTVRPHRACCVSGPSSASTASQSPLRDLEPELALVGAGDQRARPRWPRPTTGTAGSPAARSCARRYSASVCAAGRCSGESRSAACSARGCAGCWIRRPAAFTRCALNICGTRQQSASVGVIAVAAASRLWLRCASWRSSAREAERDPVARPFIALRIVDRRAATSGSAAPADCSADEYRRRC